MFGSRIELSYFSNSCRIFSTISGGWLTTSLASCSSSWLVVGSNSNFFFFASAITIRPPIPFRRLLIPSPAGRTGRPTLEASNFYRRLVLNRSILYGRRSRMRPFLVSSLHQAHKTVLCQLMNGSRAKNAVTVNARHASSPLSPQVDVLSRLVAQAAVELRSDYLI